MWPCSTCARHIRREARCPFCATPQRSIAAPVLASVLFACGPAASLDADGGGEVGSGDAASDGTGVGHSTAAATTAADETTTTGADETTTGGATDDGTTLDTTDAGAGFIYGAPDGGGISFECDLFEQDCPPGEKCMPWANDGGGAWNATRCSPVADNPATA